MILPTCLPAHLPVCLITFPLTFYLKHDTFP